MSAFPKDVEDAAKKMGGEWIKAEEFEAGPILQLVKEVEVVVASNPKYGADEKNYLVKTEVLDVGETFRYSFKTPESDERRIDSNSPALFIGFRQVEDLEVGDWLKITRTGKTDQTRYSVEKVPQPKASGSPKNTPRTNADAENDPESIDPSLIPF